MRIMNVKRAIIIFLMIGIMVIISGCARWPYGPEPEPGEKNYQLTITVEINEDGVINTTDGIYYIVLDTDIDYSASADSGFFYWGDDFYYIKLDNWGFYFAQKEEGSPELYLTDNLISGNKIQVTIALSDLEDPNSIDINVVTTDSENNTYDHLDSYFTISTVLGFAVTREDSEGDSGDGGAGFDIVKVTAVITTLY